MLKPGDNFILSCSVEKTESGLFYWYRMSFGTTIQTIAQGSYETINLKGKFKNSRFRVSKVSTTYFLEIINVSKEDEASYFCQAGSSYKMTFLNGSVLTVIDQRSQTVYVEQTPLVSVPPGGLAVFYCSLLSNKEPVQCPSKSNVFWFRTGSATSPPSILYTASDQTDEEDQKKCVYSLSKTVWNASDDGTYYCAVATCGEILFGEGTRVETKLDMLWPVCVALGLLLLCSIVINVVMFCRTVAHRKEIITTSNQFELVEGLMEDQANYEDGHVAALNYVAMDFPLRKVKRYNKKNELPQECLYSATQ